MGRSLVVLQSFPASKPTSNPYVVMLSSSLRSQPDLIVRTFTWPRALLGRFDVFHVHWPENLSSGRTRPTIAIRQFFFLLLLLKLRLTKTALVRTMHNVDLPRDANRRQRMLLRMAEHDTTLCIRLNPLTPVPLHRPSETILHGHYRDWFADAARLESQPGRVLFFGLIRRYKGVHALVRAFGSVTTAGAVLRVVGRPTSAELTRDLTELAAADDRVSMEFGFLSHSDLVHEVSRAELVVLPYPEMHNSGSLLAALSLDRPVLVPDNAVNRFLAAEVGSGWVYTFGGDIAGDDVDSTLQLVRARGDVGRPHLEAREWSDVGVAHARAYRRAVARRRGRPTADQPTADSLPAYQLPGPS